MADFPTDNAQDSYGKDVNTDSAEFQNGDLINWFPNFSQGSFGYTELCKSAFQDPQDDNSAPPSPWKAEGYQSESEGKRYIALTPDGSTAGCVGSPGSPSSPSLLAEATSESNAAESFPSGSQDSLTASGTSSSVIYPPSADLHCLAESRHNGQRQEDVPCGPPPYCSYWGDYHCFEEPSPPVCYNSPTLNTVLTPPNSPQPVSRVTSSADFLETVKACVASAARVVVQKKINKDCYGCEVKHPSQRQHACLYPPDPWYFSIHFEVLMADLLSWEFLPALKSTLEKMGLSIAEARMEGAADAFLHDLKSEENILEKVEEITREYRAEGMQRELLLDHFIDFWNP